MCGGECDESSSLKLLEARISLINIVSVFGHSFEETVSDAVVCTEVVHCIGDVKTATVVVVYAITVMHMRGSA